MSLPEHNADTQGCERGKRSRYTPPLPSAAHSGKPLYFVNLHNTKASVIGCTDANVQHQVPHKHSDYLSSGGAIKLSDAMEIGSGDVMHLLGNMGVHPPKVITSPKNSCLRSQAGCWHCLQQR